MCLVAPHSDPRGRPRLELEEEAEWLAQKGYLVLGVLSTNVSVYLLVISHLSLVAVAIFCDSKADCYRNRAVVLLITC